MATPLDQKVGELSVLELKMLLKEVLLDEPIGNEMELIPRREAARILQVTDRCIDRWCDKLILERVKIGGLSYVTKSSILRKIRKY